METSILKLGQKAPKLTHCAILANSLWVQLQPLKKLVHEVYCFYVLDYDVTLSCL